MSIKFKLVGGRLPDYTTEEHAALNLYSAESVYLDKNESYKLSTGVIPMFDQGMVGIIKTSDESPSLLYTDNEMIDSSTKRVIKINMKNVGSPKLIHRGTKIAKLIVVIANKDYTESV